MKGLIAVIMILVSYFLLALLFIKNWEILLSNTLFMVSELTAVMTLTVLFIFSLQKKSAKKGRSNLNILSGDDSQKAILVQEETVDHSLDKEKKYIEIISDLNHQLSFYHKAINQLIYSITSHLSTTTVPISQELLGIEESISHFLKDIHVYNDEIENKTNIHEIENKNKTTKEDMKMILGSINESFMSFKEKINLFETIVKKIFESSAEIENVAKKINVLSINASIESARSGEEGKGFKIISREIKNLSSQTQKLVTQINNTIKESKSIFEFINRDFQKKEEEITSKIGSQENCAAELFSVFSKYYSGFESIYQGIKMFINNISSNIHKISPVVQLHEITIQEMGNVNLVIEDLIKESLDKLEPVGQKQGEIDARLIEKMALKVRQRLTTSRELDSLELTLKSIGLDKKIDLKRDGQSVEFF